MKFFWIVILLLLSPLLALLFFRKNGSQAAPSDKSDALLGHTGPVVLPEESEYSEEADDESAEALFRQWLGVIYRDKPEEVDAIIANLEENADDEEELDFGSIIESFFLLHNNLNDTEHLFSVDWKDGESFIDFIADIADRFNAKLAWSEEQMEEGLPDQLALAAYPVLLAAGAVLYSMQTGGDYYTFIAVPQQDAADFEHASEQYGLQIWRADSEPEF